MILFIFPWKNLLKFLKEIYYSSIIDSIDFFIDFKSIRSILIPRQIFPKLTQYFRPFPASCDIIYFLVEKFVEISQEILLSIRSISLSTLNLFEVFLFLDKFFQNLFNISVLSLHRVILFIFPWKNLLKFLKKILLLTRSISLSTSKRFELFLFLDKLEKRTNQGTENSFFQTGRARKKFLFDPYSNELLPRSTTGLL